MKKIVPIACFWILNLVKINPIPILGANNPKQMKLSSHLDILAATHLHVDVA